MSNQSQLPLGKEQLLLHGLSSSTLFELCFRLDLGLFGALSLSTPSQHSVTPEPAGKHLPRVGPKLSEAACQ